MADVLGEAYIRIRPQTSGFQQEAQPGLFGAAKNLAVGIAGIFAAQKVFSFGKQAIQDAALTQKATENIKAQYKGQSGAVIKFGEDAAKAFGISKQASETFSSAIGLTGKNLGLSSAQTGKMDLGLQKLAGSVGLIKGIDPASVFEKLQQALLGNTRGLKTLGISVDATREKQALLDAGVIKATVNQAAVTKATIAYHTALKDASTAVDKYGKGTAQANLAENKAALAHQALGKAIAGTVPPLTAAQKAQGVYLVATKELPKFLDQARQHSGDLADEQRKLTAEWANAKEELGAKLLPVVQHLAGILLTDLPKAVHASESGIHALGPEIGVAESAMRGLGTATGFVVDHFRVVGPVVLGLVGTWATYRAVVVTAETAQSIYAASTRALATAQTLLTGGISGLTAAQSSNAAVQSTLTAAQAAQVGAVESLAAANAQLAVAETAATTEATTQVAATTSVAAAQAAQVAATSALAAANAELAAAETVAAEETVVLDTALASNPFGLLALGISAVVGGLIGYKAFAGQSGSTTDALTQSFRDAKSAADNLTAALAGLKAGHLDLKQAQLDVKTTAEAQSATQRAVNKLADEGKQGTKKYTDAVNANTQAQIDHKRALAEVTTAQGQIAHSSADAAAATTKFKNQLSAQANAAKQAAADNARGQLYIDRFASATKRAADQAHIASDAAARYAGSTDKLAISTAQYADTLIKKGNPAGAASQIKLAAQALAASDLTVKIGKIPSQKQINAYYKNNMKTLIQQAKDLAGAINAIPSQKTFTITGVTLQQQHGAGGVRRAAGGDISPGTFSLTGEQGPEISVSSVGRQIISHSQSVSLFANLTKSIDSLAHQIHAGRGGTPAGSGVNIQQANFVTNAMSFDALRRDALDKAALRVRR